MLAESSRGLQYTFALRYQRVIEDSDPFESTPVVSPNIVVCKLLTNPFWYRKVMNDENITPPLPNLCWNQRYAKNGSLEDVTRERNVAFGTEWYELNPSYAEGILISKLRTGQSHFA